MMMKKYFLASALMIAAPALTFAQGAPAPGGQTETVPGAGNTDRKSVV